MIIMAIMIFMIFMIIMIIYIMIIMIIFEFMIIISSGFRGRGVLDGPFF